MLYVDNYNMHADVREHLWMRSSGAAQFMESYSSYAAEELSTSNTDYYSALMKAPIPPNPSVGTIRADQGRISFDLEVTKSKKLVQERLQG